MYQATYLPGCIYRIPTIPTRVLCASCSHTHQGTMRLMLPYPPGLYPEVHIYHPGYTLRCTYTTRVCTLLSGTPPGYVHHCSVHHPGYTSPYVPHPGYTSPYVPHPGMYTSRVCTTRVCTPLGYVTPCICLPLSHGGYTSLYMPPSLPWWVSPLYMPPYLPVSLLVDTPRPCPYNPGITESKEDIPAQKERNGEIKDPYNQA